MKNSGDVFQLSQGGSARRAAVLRLIFAMIPVGNTVCAAGLPRSARAEGPFR